MPKKTRRQKQRAAVRRPSPSTAPPTASAPTGVAVEAEDLQPVEPAAEAVVAPTPPIDSSRRRVERVSAVAAAAPRTRAVKGQPSGFIQPLDSEDAAIPFDRVPYVPADLRRVAIIATIMVLLIIVADIVVSNVVK